MKKSIVLSLLSTYLYSAASFAALAPSVLPDGIYLKECTTIRAEKYDKPSGNNILTSEALSGKVDKLGITRSERHSSGVATFRTIDDTVLITEESHETFGPSNAQSSEVNSLTTLKYKTLDNGLIEESATEETQYGFQSDDKDPAAFGSDKSTYRRTFQVLDNNLEINMTVQNDNDPEKPSKSEILVTNKDGVYTVTSYNREPLRDDPKAEADGDHKPIGGMILQLRMTCTYTPPNKK